LRFLFERKQAIYLVLAETVVNLIKSNLCQCRYSKGIKGHPKVTIQKNPASVYRLKRRVSKDCKKKCENEKTCEVYAVNIEKQLCHIFTYEDLDQKKIIWEQDNDNMQWVS